MKRGARDGAPGWLLISGVSRKERNKKILKAVRRRGINWRAVCLRSQAKNKFPRGGSDYLCQMLLNEEIISQYCHGIWQLWGYWWFSQEKFWRNCVFETNYLASSKCRHWAYKNAHCFHTSSSHVTIYNKCGYWIQWKHESGKCKNRIERADTKSARWIWVGFTGEADLGKKERVTSSIVWGRHIWKWDEV